MARGKDRTESEIVAEITLGLACSSRSVGGDDKWGPSVGDWREREELPVRRGRRWAVGRFWIQAGFCPRGLLIIFVFSFLFSFLFSFEFGFETFTNF
jgi:hypothetical protein